MPLPGGSYGPGIFCTIGSTVHRLIGRKSSTRTASAGSPLDDRLHACNLRLPALLQSLLLNFNLHGVHHRYPRLPWCQLPEVFERDGHHYAGDYLGFALRQLRGPVERAGLL